jgi:penicillin-binding protein 1A
MDGRERSASETEGRPTTRRRQKRNGRDRKRGLVWLRLILVTLLLILVGLGAAVAGTVFAVTRSLPNLNSFQPNNNSLTTFFYDAKGKPIGGLVTAENRVLVKSSQIPQVMKDAIVAIEDKRFYEHHGVDFQGLARAVWEDIKAGSMVQGASTIEGQYVDNAYLGQQRSFTRKIREMWLAWQLDDNKSKDQILTDYLNTISFGEGAYGVGMAARVFFHEPLAKLTLDQAALLAAVVNAPTYYDPKINPSAAKQRRNEVLTDMQAQGYITQQQAQAALAKPIKVWKKGLDLNKGPAAYFLDYATKELIHLPGITSTMVYQGGLRVKTSLNLDWQNAALNDVKSILYSKDDPGAALVSIDPKTGFIRAMVGGQNFKKQQYNLATMTGQGRQLGSAAKPFVLTTAVEQGADPFSTYYNDQNVALPNPGGYPNPYPVAGEGHGRVTLAAAIASSLNSVYSQLGQDVGLDSFIEMMHRMGIKSPMYAYPSAPLGTNLYNPLEVADAYATLASGGVYHPPLSITEVDGPDGKVLYKAKVKGKRVISQGVAYVVTKCLEGVIQYGTGAAHGNIGRPAAGKTGTTNNNANAWFCGYTPQLTTAVWMGYVQSNNIPMNNVNGIQVWGGDFPTLIWANFMKAALAKSPVVDFAQPAVMPLYSKWDRKYSNLAPSPSPSPSPTKTKKPSGKPTTSGSPTPSTTASPTTPPPTTPPPTTPPPTTPPPTTPPPPTPSSPATPTTAPSVRVAMANVNWLWSWLSAAPAV